jgi:aspartyl-tRNA(Asn)/glutamyl-tRNA(Gln) amidotransferase subunit C
MAKITKEELLHLAALSKLRLDEAEIPSLISQIESILSYSARVQQAVTESMGEEQNSKNINIVREDVQQRGDIEAILAQAPEREEDFFVVPVIIEK